jgi:hypothetical protein
MKWTVGFPACQVVVARQLPQVLSAVLEAVAQQCVGTCCLCVQVVINFFNSRLDSMKENSAAAPEDAASWNVNRVLELVQTFAQVGTNGVCTALVLCVSAALAIHLAGPA